MTTQDSFYQDAATHSTQPAWRRNLSFFSRGTPRLILIVGALVTTVAMAAGIRGLVKNDDVGVAVSRVDVPAAPKTRISSEPVEESIAAARAKIDNEEASDAYVAGQSYQPSYDPNIKPDSRLDYPSQGAQFGNLPSFAESSPMQAQAQQDNAQPASPRTAQAASRLQTSQQARATIDEEERQLEAELQKATAARDQYKLQAKKEIVDEMTKMFGEGSAYLPDKGLGQYSMVAYPSAAPVSDSAVAASAAAAAAERAMGRKPKIKTGNVLYGELDSGINTDDGSEVMATIRGGEWDGSRLIGQISRAPNNIGIKFTILAPQDDRPTMRINAVAIREEDAKLGIAEDINHHYFQRYGALAVSSLLAGAGRVFQTQGTTVFHPSGTVAMSNPDPQDRQIIGSAAGELGTTLSQEFRKDVNRPTTYSAPAGQGFGLYFMDDVF